MSNKNFDDEKNFSFKKSNDNEKHDYDNVEKNAKNDNRESILNSNETFKF